MQTLPREQRCRADELSKLVKKVQTLQVFIYAAWSVWDLFLGVYSCLNVMTVSSITFLATDRSVGPTVRPRLLS